MSDYTLQNFIQDCETEAAAHSELADTVRAITPLMHRLICGTRNFLKPEHFQSESDHYARNLVYATDGVGLSLYTLVWLPGQWTPVHDHGTWGVVGVIEGQLEEQNYMRADPEQSPERHAGIELRRGGLALLSPGSVSTFVPNPDHIHKTGCADDRPTCVSLHLYGRAMNSFYCYDIANGTRTLIEAAHNETRLGQSGEAA
jgi:predicted metal-dependent enzyme (double-stranded beta helix superfamily)